LSLDLLCIASADGYFKRVSPAVTEILGWTPEEFLARPYLDFEHPDDHAATLLEVEKQIKAGQRVLQFENRYRHKDGSWRVLSWCSMPHGELMYAIARDMTEKNAAATQIAALSAEQQRRAAQLEAVNKELEAFSYSVSHDLRAPLRHIDGFVDLLRKQSGDKLDERSRRYLQVITDAARQMGHLIDDLLVFSRMGRAELRQQTVDVDALVHEAVTTLQSETNGRHITWKIAPLPQVQADAAMLRQVWVNLIANAVKYSRPRDPAVIEIGCAAETPVEYEFFVRDNGVGFDMEYVDKLFGVFQRLHRAEEFEGTGIGLANVRRIVLRHGGRTWAEGKVDAGATFYFTLPKSRENGI
jgi:PAS domain S-box-containing protein